MIRITASEEASQTIITIDGELSGEHVATVESYCEEAESSGKPITVFLRDVTAVDQSGEVLLVRLVKAGFALTGIGVYTSYLVDAITSPDTKSRTL